MRESALEIKNRFEGPEMREEEQSGIMFRCLCWVMPLADVRKKKGRFGLEDDKLSFRHATSEVFSEGNR